jgi:DnaJ-class molecular chaperone
MDLLLLPLLARDPGDRPGGAQPLSCVYCGQPSGDYDEHESCFQESAARACPQCGGRGVLDPRDEFGNYDGCGYCEGTGIHPDDPAFPA